MSNIWQEHIEVPLPTAVIEQLEERAAILEHEAGFSKQEAEFLAALNVRKYLSDWQELELAKNER